MKISVMKTYDNSISFLIFNTYLYLVFCFRHWKVVFGEREHRPYQWPCVSCGPQWSLQIRIRFVRQRIDPTLETNKQKVFRRANLLIYNLVLRPLVGQQRPRWQPRPRRPWQRLRAAVMAGVTYSPGRLQQGLARVLQQKPFLRAKCPSLVKLRSHCCYLTKFLVRAR